MAGMNDFIKHIQTNPRSHVFVVGSAKLGVRRFTQAQCSKLAPGATKVIDATSMKVDEARALIEELHTLPEMGVECWQVIVMNAEKLKREVLPQFLAIMEEGQWARFVFHANAAPGYLGPIKSRCTIFKLAFMGKRQVLANMQALHLDARAADEADVYDGTLEGTVQRLAIKDALDEVEKQTGAFENIPALLQAVEGYDPAMLGVLTHGEREFIMGAPQPIRRRLVVMLRAIKDAQAHRA